MLVKLHQVLVSCDGNALDGDLISWLPRLWNEEQEAANCEKQTGKEMSKALRSMSSLAIILL